MINYYLITKPGIILGNLITVAAGFLLASKGHMYLGLFLATMLGLTLIIASGCIFNNYIDRDLDIKMKRTKNRPLASGQVSVVGALGLAILLVFLGNGILLYFTNSLTTAVADVGFLTYVLLYSFWKSKTVYATAIGSIAGAVPPLVGYCAVSNQIDLGAVILFLMLVTWQMPHFFAIAILHYEDYRAAGIPTLPISKGIYRSKIHMVLYIMAFIASTALLTLSGYTGYIYLAVAGGLGTVWLGICLKGFIAKNDHRWAREMFRFSLVLITATSGAILLDVYP